MNTSVINLEVLLERLDADGDPPVDRALRLEREFEAIMSGALALMSPRYGTVLPATAIDQLFDALDASDRRELIAIADGHVRRRIAKFTKGQGVDEKTFANLVSITFNILKGKAIYVEVVRLCERLIRAPAFDNIELTVEAARFLYDAGAFGEDKEVWIRLCDRDPANSIRFLPTVVLSLLRKWPDDGLMLLFKYCVDSPAEDQEKLAAFVGVFGSVITSSVSADDYLKGFVAIRDVVEPDLRLAFEEAAEARGWELPPENIEEYRAPEPAQTGDLVPVLVRRAPDPGSPWWDWVFVSPAAGGPQGAISENAEKVRGPALANQIGLASRQGDLPEHQRFPTPQKELFSQVRRRSIQISVSRLEEGGLELGYVRQCVKGSIDESIERDSFVEDDVLMHSVESYFAFHAYAQEAEKRLSHLGFNRKPFMLGASEFHQDRLSMAIVSAALRRAGLMGVRVSHRQWDDKSMLLFREGTEANVVTRGRFTASPSETGLFAFEGFRLFARCDALRDLVTEGRVDEIAGQVAALLDCAENGGDVQEALSIQARANVALHLGLISARGSAFEGLRSAVEILAKGKSTPGQSEVEVTNDEALKNFITGRAAIYCGGAINSLLIDTWWRDADPRNFIELLCHDELKSGFQVEGPARARKGPVFVENYLEFGGLGDSKSRPVRQAQQALTALFRAVGRGMQAWSGEVMAHEKHLNGLGRPCEAARRILRPSPEFRTGHFAFVTSGVDPARLIHQADRHYRMDGKAN